MTKILPIQFTYFNFYLLSVIRAGIGMYTRYQANCSASRL